MRHLTTIGVRLFLTLISLCSAVAAAEPQNGWWWNPAESGRGFYIERQGDVLFMAGYFYEQDGRATWLISSGTMTHPKAYTGRLLSAAGGQTLVGPYQAPALADAGEITLAFTDDVHGSLRWPGGTIPIQRQVWSEALNDVTLNGWWWNPAQSGRGYAVEVQGDILVMAAFMYDPQGRPLWYLSSGKMASSHRYEGALLQFAGGQTMSGPYAAPTAASIGGITIDWTSEDSALLTLSDVVPAAGAAVAPHGFTPKTSEAMRIERELGKYSRLPLTLTGRMSQMIDSAAVPITVGLLPTAFEVKNTYVELASVTWFSDNAPGTATGSRTYQPSGTASVHVLRETLDATILGIAFDHCKGDATGKTPLGRASGSLTLQASGSYEGWVGASIPVDIKEVCQKCNQITGCTDYVRNSSITVMLALPISGTSPYPVLLEGRRSLTPSEGVTVDESWYLAPKSIFQ